MPTQTYGTNGADGANGATGANATDLVNPSGNGGDGAAGTDAGSLTVTVTQEAVDADAAHDLRYAGGIAGNGGTGGYAGQLFNDHQAVRTGDHEVQNDYFSAAGNGGNAGNAGNGGSVAVTATSLGLGNGVTLLATGTNGGWAGAGGNGGAGATDIHNTEAAWQTYVDEELVQHIVSLDYTSHGASGGNGGNGGVGGNAGDASVDFTGNKVQGNVWLVAQGGNGGFGWSGGGGGAGNDPGIGGVGGHGGQGGNATLTVDGNSFGFNANITFTAWGGMGGLGGVGGSGGYGLTAEGVENVYALDYTYAMGGSGGDGGDAGSGAMSVTNNQFVGGDFADNLKLSLHLNAGAVGTGGRGGIGALESVGYDGSDGTDGAYGSTSLWFDGNVLDGEGGVDTLDLLVNNMTTQVSPDGAGLTPLPMLDINLGTGTVLFGNGVNAIDDIENVSVEYRNSYYNGGTVPISFGHVSLTGNASANILTTGGGDDMVNGGDGDDTLKAGNGNDTLDGGTGADAMYGSGGDDTYYIDNAGDVIYEGRYEGTDTVHSTITLSMAGKFVEIGILDGTDNLNLAGNGLDNTFIGNSGNNRLNGASGADSMSGGAGNDVYFVDNTGDTVWENSGEGWDTVYNFVSFTLGDNVEALTLQGYQAINGTGNSGNNTLTGNGANNWLDGGDGNDTIQGSGGNDTLTGGTGIDTFVFSHFGAANGLDTVSDFVSGTDRLMFTASDFGFSPGHVLTGAEFRMDFQSGTGGQFIFNSTNHRLYWDADGTGSGAPVGIAILSGVTSITAADFVFV